jgi:predicted ATPase
MRIKSIYVNNFKSLVDFKIEFAKFNCLIGLNGSGKSTFLQFVDFLAQLMRGNTQNWLNKYKINSLHLPFFKDNKEHEIKFRIDFTDNEIKYWDGIYNIDYSRCTHETVQMGDTVFTVDNNPNKKSKKYSIQKLNQDPFNQNINFDYQGSIFSQLADTNLSESKEFDNFKQTIKSLQTFGLLTPFFLKQNTKDSNGSIGYEGGNLSAFLYDIKEEQRVTITRKLKTVYPNFGFFKSNVLNDQTKTLTIGEIYRNGDSTYQTSLRNINDGLLRITAFLAELESKHQILLFDEIENGINPELIGFLLKELIETKKQIIATTHSPMILNYLDDDIAIPGIHFFYKTPSGFTQTIPFLSIPSMREKLEMMGPGEVFIDTNLTQLITELSENFQTQGKEK